MIYNFCTLFDSNYFSRGIVLYNSLRETGVNFHLYIFAFDDNVYEKLIKRNLEKATIISLNDFETKELLEKKEKRTKAEYCWTCTPSTIYYCLMHFNLENCTYVDADMYFFNNPEVLFKEIGQYSVAITDHNYFKKYDQSKTSGKYCVQFIYFKNDLIGLSALDWWKKSCINWCYSRLEEDKFGDQKYLESFPKLFNNILVLENKGAGLAPWNAQRFVITNDKTLHVKDIYTSIEYQIVFFHFHNLNYSHEENSLIVKPSKFILPHNYIDLIYKPYIKKLYSIENNEKFIIEDEIKIKINKINWLYNLYLDLRLFLKKLLIFRFLYSTIYKSTK
jgi:hypothetical protein